MPVSIIITILLVHCLADFFLQNDWMAVNKSKNPFALLAHVIVYGLAFLPLFGPSYALFNALMHFVVDFISSRITTHFWKKEERHWFFCTIGVDQFIHYVFLISTWEILAWK